MILLVYHILEIFCSNVKINGGIWELLRIALGVFNRWTGIWNRMVEWKME